MAATLAFSPPTSGDAEHAMGAPRITTVVKINTPTDKDQTLKDKVAGVVALLQ